MKPSRIVLLLVAILAGGLAAFLATRGDRPAQVAQGPQQVVIQEAKAQVLVAAAPIGVGQRLTAATLQWQDWPEGAVRPEYVTIAAMPDAIAQMSGAVARFEIFPGEPIREQKLVRADQGYLSAVLAKGMRGVSIAVSADSASGGFIVPNDHVDVVLTRAADAGEISETILHNVKVLAIGSRLGETGTTGGPEDPEDPRADVFSEAIATLELDPGQAETIINAGRVGQLSLALRSIADFAETPDERQQRPANQTVRLIKYGQEVSVMAGAGPKAAIAPATFEPASYTTDSPQGEVSAPEPAVDAASQPQVE
jgi:pilus assembly protein CpaB